MDKVNLEHKAHLLRLKALSLAHGMKYGSFKSLYRGQGIDFTGNREYLFGDDTRGIDWNVTARMGKLYVKVFEEERELDVFIILDKSLSMTTGSVSRSRMDTAVEAASLIALACKFNNSPVGAVIFDSDIKFSCPPKSCRDQSLFLISQFEKPYDTETKGSALDSAIKGALRQLKKRALVMIFSDFRTSGWKDNFGMLCAKHDVVAVRITDRMDEELPSIGTVSFVDAESGKMSVLPTSGELFAREWRTDNYRRVDLWKNECVRRGGIPLMLDTSLDPALVLTDFFESREQL